MIVDVEASKFTVKGDSPLRSTGSVVILATMPRARTGVVWPSSTAEFFPAADGSPKFWLTTPLMPSGTPINGAHPEAPGTAKELLTRRRVPLVRYGEPVIGVLGAGGDVVPVVSTLMSIGAVEVPMLHEAPTYTPNGEPLSLMRNLSRMFVTPVSGLRVPVADVVGITSAVTT